MNCKSLLILFFLFLFCLFVIGQPLQAGQKKNKERLAVLDLEAQYGVDKELAEVLSGIVRDKIHSFGEYQVMSQDDIRAVATREQLKQAMGCDDEGSQCLVDFGRKIGTRFMVAGDIAKLGSTFTVSLRMLDTQGESAGVINRVRESCKCTDDALIGTVEDVAAKLLGKPTSSAKKAEEDEAAAKRITSESKRVIEAEIQRKADEEKKNQTSSPAVAGPPSPPKTYTDPQTGMAFVYVPAGCFQMGDTFGDGASEEKPVHEVCVDAFYIGKYEVTQGEYLKITKNFNPSTFKSGDRYPVENVSWLDIQSVIRSLNVKPGNKYRLPTEAEWEYAARSGGKKEKYAGGDDVDTVAWYKKNSGSSTHPVGEKRPNGLGIYDMSGNVWEWCQDWFDPNYYDKSPRENPTGLTSGSERVYRGGCWYGIPGIVRATLRFKRPPDRSSNDLGFRLVLPVQ